jgi:hypothetical protein
LAVTTLLALACIAGVAFVVLRHPFAPPVTQYATRLVRVRSAANATASAVLGSLQRGDSVVGTLMTGQDNQTRWLKIKWGPAGEAYVWARNLSALERPVLTTFSDSRRTALSESPLRAEPDDAAAIVDTVAAGGPVQTVGTTATGWVEVARDGGGVGYLRADVLQIGTSPVPMLAESSAVSATPNPDAATSAAAAQRSADDARAAAMSAQEAANGSAVAVTRYVCAVAPELSENPIPGAHAMSFSLDESRSCINNRSVYLRRQNGLLKRIMLIDKDRRAAMLIISPQRNIFTRIDYMLTPDAYTSTRQAYPLLVDITCAPPGNQQVATNLQESLSRADPSFNVRTGAVTSWRRTVWRCAALGQ